MDHELSPDHSEEADFESLFGKEDYSYDNFLHDVAIINKVAQQSTDHFVKFYLCPFQNLDLQELYKKPYGVKHFIFWAKRDREKMLDKLYEKVSIDEPLNTDGSAQVSSAVASGRSRYALLLNQVMSAKDIPTQQTFGLPDRAKVSVAIDKIYAHFVMYYEQIDQSEKLLDFDDDVRLEVAGTQLKNRAVEGFDFLHQKYFDARNLAENIRMTPSYAVRVFKDIVNSPIQPERSSQNVTDIRECIQVYYTTRASLGNKIITVALLDENASTAGAELPILGEFRTAILDSIEDSENLDTATLLARQLSEARASLATLKASEDADHGKEIAVCARNIRYLTDHPTDEYAARYAADFIDLLAKVETAEPTSSDVNVAVGFIKEVLPLLRGIFIKNDTFMSDVDEAVGKLQQESTTAAEFKAAESRYPTLQGIVETRQNIKIAHEKNELIDLSEIKKLIHFLAYLLDDESRNQDTTEVIAWLQAEILSYRVREIGSVIIELERVAAEESRQQTTRAILKNIVNSICQSHKDPDEQEQLDRKPELIVEPNCSVLYVKAASAATVLSKQPELGHLWNWLRSLREAKREQKRATAMKLQRGDYQIDTQTRWEEAFVVQNRTAIAEAVKYMVLLERMDSNDQEQEKAISDLKEFIHYFFVTNNSVENQKIFGSFLAELNYQLKLLEPPRQEELLQALYDPSAAHKLSQELQITREFLKRWYDLSGNSTLFKLAGEMQTGSEVFALVTVVEASTCNLLKRNLRDLVKNILQNPEGNLPSAASWMAALTRYRISAIQYDKLTPADTAALNGIESSIRDIYASAGQADKLEQLTLELTNAKHLSSHFGSVSDAAFDILCNWTTDCKQPNQVATIARVDLLLQEYIRTHADTIHEVPNKLVAARKLQPLLQSICKSRQVNEEVDKAQELISSIATLAQELASITAIYKDDDTMWVLEMICYPTKLAEYAVVTNDFLETDSSNDLTAQQIEKLQTLKEKVAEFVAYLQVDAAEFDKEIMNQRLNLAAQHVSSAMLPELSGEFQIQIGQSLEEGYGADSFVYSDSIDEKPNQIRFFGERVFAALRRATERVENQLSPKLLEEVILLQDLIRSRICDIYNLDESQFDTRISRYS